MYGILYDQAVLVQQVPPDFIFSLTSMLPISVFLFEASVPVNRFNLVINHSAVKSGHLGKFLHDIYNESMQETFIN